MSLISRLFSIGLVVVAAQAAAGGTTAPEPIFPDTLTWAGPPNNPKAKGAWVVGSENQAGVYAFRVVLQKGGRLPPHTHPDTRYSTVLSGTLYVGFGEQADDSRLVAVPAGAVYIAPRGVAHYLYARDGDVVYQEGGMGPTATIPVSH